MAAGRRQTQVRPPGRLAAARRALGPEQDQVRYQVKPGFRQAQGGLEDVAIRSMRLRAGRIERRRRLKLVTRLHVAGFLTPSQILDRASDGGNADVHLVTDGQEPLAKRASPFT